MTTPQPTGASDAVGFRFRIRPIERRNDPWNSPGIVAEWNKPTPQDNETIQYQTLYTTPPAQVAGSGMGDMAARTILASALAADDCPIDPASISVDGVVRVDIVLSAIKAALAAQPAPGVGEVGTYDIPGAWMAMHWIDRYAAGIDDVCQLDRVADALAATRPAESVAQGGEPIKMILHCPQCRLQHIDAPDDRTPEWKNEPHRSHLCHGCGFIWRPADVATEGVAAIETKGKADSPTPATGSGGEAVAEVRYEPNRPNPHQVKWLKHPKDLIGQKLYTHPTPAGGGAGDDPAMEAWPIDDMRCTGGKGDRP